MTLTEKKRLIAISTWLGILTISIMTAIIYTKQLQHYNDAVKKKSETITRLKRQTANKPALENAISRLEQLMDKSNIFMQAPNSQVADAQLLSLVKKIIKEAKGEIRSITPLGNHRNKSNNSRIDIIFSATQPALIQIIKHMASSNPLLSITKAEIIPQMKVRGRQRVETGEIRARLQVESFFAPRGGQP